MTPLQPGDRLDHYRLDRLVAMGGMASVFQATDLDTGGKVAIKVPHPEVEREPQLFERFRREEAIGLKLNHPGVVKVLPDGKRSRVYMVMEWVEGRSLKQIIEEEGKLPIDRAIRLTISICNALEYAHSQSVVHRDLKPENILIDSEDRIKLIDFGIAGQAGARRITFAKFSDTMGTPEYISPEQVKGQRGTARSDVYTVGVLLYEMLTGKVPFTGDSPFVVMNERLLNNPVPPRELNPAISPQLQEVIYRALERDPRNRYSSARDMAWDLEHLDQVGVADRAELRNWRNRRTPRTRQILVYVGLAMIPLVLFALLLFAARH
jgi:serine/threonine-protein kinase